jgi:SAM-dependent methyltransferase
VLNDGWSAGATYEAFMGRWSRLLADRFVPWLGIAPGAHWLDVGCGTGSLTNAICAGASPASVVACDPAESFVEYARQHERDAKVSFVVTGVGHLPTRSGGFNSIASALALNFFPAPAAAIDEMRGLAAPGGLISACVWDYGGRMEFLRYFWDAATALDANARTLDEGHRFPLCRPEALETLFRDRGLDDVVCDAIEIPTRFETFAAFWTPLLGGTGPAPAYVAGLAPAQRERLASLLENSLPHQPDGAITLVARAWAVRGSVGEAGR